MLACMAIILTQLRTFETVKLKPNVFTSYIPVICVYEIQLGSGENSWGKSGR